MRLQLVILEREAAHAATKDIMTVHCIPKDRSADLLPETNGIQTAASVCWPACVSSIFTLFLQSQDATPFCKAGAGTHSIFAVGSRFQDISLLGANSQVSMSIT